MAGPVVLLVEDSGFMATHAAETLEATRPMAVRTADRAERAREMLAASEYDCLVVNTQLPDENGIEFVRSVREDPSLPALPALLFTGQSLEDVAERAFEAGVTDVVSKNHHAGDSMAVFANRIEITIDAFAHRR
jgi:CheY-like chemotaxis protein